VILVGDHLDQDREDFLAGSTPANTVYRDGEKLRGLFAQETLNWKSLALIQWTL